jgi:acyl-CoA synthetase (AMP-forming)/AMP-acid ligase II
MGHANSSHIFYSTFPDVEIPEVSLPDYIRSIARRLGDRPAIVDAATNRSYSYAELDRLIGRFAAGLAGIGFKPGDILLIFAPNSPEWAIAALGAMAAGGVISGANSLYTPQELAHQARTTGASFALTIPAFLPMLKQAIAGTGCKTILTLGPAEGTLDFFDLVKSDSPEPKPGIKPTDLAALPCSSGTSGLPKSVMLTHASIVANIVQTNAVLQLEADTVGLAFLPMFHIMGFSVVLLSGLASGIKLVTIPRFEPEQFLKTIASHRITDLAVVPPIVQFLAGHPMVDAFDLKSLRFIGCGAAPLSRSLATRVEARLGVKVGEGYGMTESSGCITSNVWGAARDGSIGLLVPGTRARVVDPESGQDVAPGQAGELWFSGPQAFRGYLDNPAATQATIDQDNWIHTGDVVRIEQDGYVYITDRLKELIKVNAFQVAPAELEALLLTHPKVADAAVISRPDERTGEKPVAYVVFRGEPEPAALMEWVAQQVVEYKRLGDVVPCTEIPKSPSGKILRRMLREQDKRLVAMLP